MTMTQQQQQAILEVLEEKIMQSLLKLKAREENELRAKFNGVPEPILTQALKNLNEASQIRRVQSKSGIILIALESATTDDLHEACDRYNVIEGESQANTYLKATRAELIRNLDPKLCRDEPHYSEHPHFGLSYEAALHADYLEAQIPDRITSEFPTVTRRNGQHITDNMDDDKIRLVMRQELTGQGFRNSKRAFRRYKAREHEMFATVSNPDKWAEKNQPETITPLREDRTIKVNGETYKVWRPDPDANWILLDHDNNLIASHPTISECVKHSSLSN